MKAPIVHARTVEDARARARSVARPGLGLPPNATIQQIAEHRAADLRLRDWRLKVSLTSGPTVIRARVDSKDATNEIHAGPRADHELLGELVKLHILPFGESAHAAHVANVLTGALLSGAPPPVARVAAPWLDAKTCTAIRNVLALSDRERAMCAEMKVDPITYADLKARRRA